MSRVAEKLKSLRSEKGLSQKDLAKKLGVGEAFIKDLELGRKVAPESFLNKITKVFGKDLNDISLSIEIEADEESFSEQLNKSFASSSNAPKQTKTPVKKAEVSEVWDSAFSSVLKEVPIYDANYIKVIDKKLLPIVGKKINGFPADKVFFFEIPNDDLIGFRISKGDLAFAHQSTELSGSNGTYLLNKDGKKVIRQVKKLDSAKALLIYNQSSVRTETVYIKDLKVIAKIESVEIKL